MGGGALNIAANGEKIRLIADNMFGMGTLPHRCAVGSAPHSMIVGTFLVFGADSDEVGFAAVIILRQP